MVVTLGQQYNVGEKPTVILYTYINHQAQPPNITQHITSVVHQLPAIQQILASCEWSHPSD